MQSLTKFEVTYNGASFLLDVADGKMMSLNTIYAASGSPANRDPRVWMRSVEAKRFIENLCSELDVKKAHIVRSSKGGKGGGGGTWAHWKIATKYAAYLEPALESAILSVFQERIQEEKDPNKTINRGVDAFKRQGKSDKWIGNRLQSIAGWRALTDTLKEHDVTNHGYAMAADAINVPILGKTATQFKQEKGLKKTDSTRNELDSVQLAMLSLSQALSQQKIIEKDVRGNMPCATVCRDVSTKVAAIKDAI